ncbi:LysR substrate-binding domain-containing protein [Halocynthiibacter namhaensis]|uniref:LysR substrate-binding domain-containing protein n=1 Tax=Halocynthiibacter namhaensis TaxID=1290553 RepID=UPI00138E4367|nr:LysR substrate-binding domain-containing protein [Halocynthiibacter namhaensis]
MSHLPSLTALRAFEAAARYENFREAAEELNVTHGAVAQQIRGLEADLKTPLFQRLTRGVKLTPEGRAYAADIRQGLHTLKDATNKVLGKAEKTALVLSVTPSFASCWLLPRLPGFSDLSKVDLQVSASEATSDVVGGEADLAIRQSPPPYAKGITHKLLFPGDNVIVGLPNLIRGIVTVEDLCDSNLLHDGHAGWAGYFARNLGVVPDKVENGLRFNQAAMCIRMACGGEGIALVPKILVQKELADGTLVEFSGPAPDAGSGFYLVWSEKHGCRRDVSRVCDWLLQQADA